VRYRRLARRIGKIKALVTMKCSVLVIVSELLADPTKRYTHPRPGFFDNRVRPERRNLNHIRQRPHDSPPNVRRSSDQASGVRPGPPSRITSSPTTSPTTSPADQLAVNIAPRTADAHGVIRRLARPTPHGVA
jgi:hypothetical protein